MAEGVDVTGIVAVGEVITRVYREAQVADDFQHAKTAASVSAYQSVLAFAEERIAAAGPYDDLRALQELISWTADRIRETQSLNGQSDATREA